MSAAQESNPIEIYHALCRIQENKPQLLRALVHTRAALSDKGPEVFSSRIIEHNWVDKSRQSQRVTASSAMRLLGLGRRARVTPRLETLIELLRADFFVELVGDCALSLQCLQMLHESLAAQLVDIEEAIQLLEDIVSFFESKGEELEGGEIPLTRAVLELVANAPDLQLPQELQPAQGEKFREGLKIIGSPTYVGASQAG